MKLAIALAAAAALLPAAASAAIVDGSFEAQAAASISPNAFCYLNGGCATGVWSSNGSGGFIGVNNGDWPGQQGDGSYIGFLQGAGSLVQTFTADTTGRFALTFQNAGRSRPGYDGPHSYTVSLNGTEIFAGATRAASRSTSRTPSRSAWPRARATNWRSTASTTAPTRPRSSTVSA